MLPVRRPVSRQRSGGRPVSVTSSFKDNGATPLASGNPPTRVSGPELNITAAFPPDRSDENNPVRLLSARADDTPGSIENTRSPSSAVGTTTGVAVLVSVRVGVLVGVAVTVGVCVTVGSVDASCRSSRNRPGWRTGRRRVATMGGLSQNFRLLLPPFTCSSPRPPGRRSSR